jgi:hypothetical protein
MLLELRYCTFPFMIQTWFSKCTVISSMTAILSIPSIYRQAFARLPIAPSKDLNELIPAEMLSHLKHVFKHKRTGSGTPMAESERFWQAKNACRVSSRS